MALATKTPTFNGWPVFPNDDIGSDFKAATVRATVVQASTIYYDTPATLGAFTSPLWFIKHNGYHSFWIFLT